MADYLSVAIDAARQAGRLQREGLKKPLSIRESTRHDVKLQMDVDCETLIRDILLKAFPDHALLGEEGGGEIASDTPTWIVDPLDGTMNYSRKLPHFCTSIALQLNGRAIIGVVYDPIRDELFTASEGGGAFLNDELIRVSENPLDQAIIAMGFAKTLEAISNMLKNINELAQTVRKVRILGAAALEMAYVACGRLDGFLEYGLRSWDIAAGTLIIQEAGGNVNLTQTGKYEWDVKAHNGKLW